MRVAEAAQILALEAQLALERERVRTLEAQLRNLADHDPLTDLLNRRSFELELEEHLAGCNRYGPDGALLVIGIAGLADLTSALGRWESDETLALVAERVTGRLRNTDVVGRWATDELSVLLPRVGDGGAEVVAEALVEIVGGTGTPRVPPGSLTASIGVALVVATPIEAVRFVEQARQAMADARRRGCGCWVAAEIGNG